MSKDTYRCLSASLFKSNVLADLASDLREATKVPERPGVHAMSDLGEDYTPLELVHIRVEVDNVTPRQEAWAHGIEPNLPWAEDHFQERISGKPLNPSPSHEYWPFAQRGNQQHRDEHGQFSHTYPERFWPKFANVGHKTREGRQVWVPQRGIRFLYGDLHDLLSQLSDNPWTRQAYLPVWFPEDLAAACAGERVPCTLGYHFMMNPLTKQLDMEYHIRSCDFIRFFRDDLYMAGRLLQWVAHCINIKPGSLIMNIANLHCFVGDMRVLTQMTFLEEDDDDW